MFRRDAGAASRPVACIVRALIMISSERFPLEMLCSPAARLVRAAQSSLGLPDSLPSASPETRSLLTPHPSGVPPGSSSTLVAERGGSPVLPFHPCTLQLFLAALLASPWASGLLGGCALAGCAFSLRAACMRPGRLAMTSWLGRFGFLARS